MKRKVIREAIIPAGEPWSAELNRGQVLRIIDLEGQQGLDFLCYNKSNPEERYSAPHSIKKAATLNLTRGNVLYSDAARAMVTIIEDTCGHNDTIAGCCSEQTNWLFYGKNESHGSCRSNFLKAMKPYGLGWRDLVPNVNFFCIVPVSPDGSIPASTFAAPPSKPAASRSKTIPPEIKAGKTGRPERGQPVNCSILSAGSWKSRRFSGFSTPWKIPPSAWPQPLKPCARPPQTAMVRT